MSLLISIESGEFMSATFPDFTGPGFSDPDAIVCAIEPRWIKKLTLDG
jgi:hypothetical protein